MKRIKDFLSSVPMTIIGGFFLLLSFILPKVNVSFPIDPAWATVIISGVPLLYLAVWRILYNPGIKKISSALLITIAMIALGLGAGGMIDKMLHSHSLKNHHI